MKKTKKQNKKMHEKERNGEQTLKTKIFYGFLMALIVFSTYELVVIFSSSDERKIEDEILESQITWLKCISSCPVIQSEETLIEKNFEDSCFFDCKKYQYEGNVSQLSENRIKELDRILGPGTDCFIQMRYNRSFDYNACFKNFFEDNKKIADLDDFEHLNYTIYNPEISELDCGRDHAKINITMKSGEDDLKIAFVFVKEICKNGVCERGYSRISNEFNAPNVGESKVYFVDYIANNVQEYNPSTKKFEFYNVSFVDVVLRTSGQEKTSVRNIGDFDSERC